MIKFPSTSGRGRCRPANSVAATYPGVFGSRVGGAALVGRAIVGGCRVRGLGHRRISTSHQADQEGHAQSSCIHGVEQGCHCFICPLACKNAISIIFRRGEKKTQTGRKKKKIRKIKQKKTGNKKKKTTKKKKTGKKQNGNERGKQHKQRRKYKHTKTRIRKTDEEKKKGRRKEKKKKNKKKTNKNTKKNFYCVKSFDECHYMKYRVTGSEGTTNDHKIILE